MLTVALPNRANLDNAVPRNAAAGFTQVISADKFHSRYRKILR